MNLYNPHQKWLEIFFLFFADDVLQKESRKKMNNIIEVWRKIYFIKKRWQLLCIDILIN